MGNYKGEINQVDWEVFWRHEAKVRYLARVDDLAEKNMQECIGVCDSLIREYVLCVAKVVMDKVEKSSKRKKRPAEHDVISSIDIASGAFLAIRAVVKRCFTSYSGEYVASELKRGFSSIAIEIGREIETEEMCRFLEGKGVFVEKKKRILKFEDSRRRFVSEEAMGEGWSSWPLAVLSRIGAVFLVAMEGVGFVKTTLMQVGRKRKCTVVDFSDSVSEWVYSSIEAVSEMVTGIRPMIEKPIDVGIGNYSSFHSEYLRNSEFCIPIWLKDGCTIKGRVFGAINILQGTGYIVNEKVLDVLSELLVSGCAPSVERKLELPERFMDWVGDDYVFNEAELEEFRRHKALIRKVKLHNSKAMQEMFRASSLVGVCRELKRLGDRFNKEIEFWFPWFIDFRGRIYPKFCGLSLHGGDMHRGVVLFSEKRHLGDDGLKWLKVAGYSLYVGGKVCYEDRELWVDDNQEAIVECARNPCDRVSIDFWGKACEPYQFLAFCFEYERLLKEGVDKFKTGFPVTIDGSCNAIQHISAILGDNRLAGMVNLVESDCPVDIYGIVLDKVVQRLNDDCSGNERFSELLGRVNIDRGFVKGFVMTFPMSAKTGYKALKLVRDIKSGVSFTKEEMEFATWICGVITSVVVEVLGCTDRLSEWLRHVVRRCADVGKDVSFTVGTGVKVGHRYKRQDRLKIKVKFLGIIRTFTVKYDSGSIDIAKSCNSITANFIQSMDAVHLTNSINEFNDCVISSHDSVSVHPSEVSRMQRILAKEFCDMYSADILGDMKREIEKEIGVVLEEPPLKGDFDVKEVIGSKYFFA